MFGDNEAIFDKFRTCARVRAKENQKLGLNFYTKESSKPIFKKMKLLTEITLRIYTDSAA